MFRGINTVSVDAKNRLALPSKIREILRDNQINDLVMTLNPWDRSIWLYPFTRVDKNRREIIFLE